MRLSLLLTHLGWGINREGLILSVRRALSAETAWKGESGTAPLPSHTIRFGELDEKEILKSPERNAGYLFRQIGWTAGEILKSTQKTAVHVEYLAGNEIRGWRRQEDRRGRQVFGRSPAPHGRALLDPGVEFFIFPQRPGQFGSNVAGAKTVHVDMIPRPVHSQGLGQLTNPAFRGGVGSVIFSYGLTQQRRDIDYLARTTGGDAFPCKCPAQGEHRFEIQG